MSLRFMGKKRGMIQYFDETGKVIVGTVIEAEPNVVAQVKTKESDGYEAIQLGFEKIQVADKRTMEKRVSKPLRGHFQKNSIEPRRHLTESRVEKASEYTVGQEISVAAFSEVAYVDVMAQSKGKGYQGVIKLHNMSGGPASHGSGFHRHAGSTGMRSTPGRCLPGGPRPSHMGDDRITVQNLEVVMVNVEENVIIVKGAVPGPRNGLVYVSQAVKLKNKKKDQKK